VSRRNQTRRRRSYGRRQHETRERRLDSQPGTGWPTDANAEFDADWQTTDGGDERSTYESFGGFGS
jgi:hypothetical protein